MSPDGAGRPFPPIDLGEVGDKEHIMNIYPLPGDPLRQLKARIAVIEGRSAAGTCARVALGHAAIDRVLGGGLARGRLHELFAIDAADASSATGFAGMLAIRLGGGILWLRELRAERQGVLHAAGMMQIGIDPGRLIVGLLPDAVAVLRAAADAVRCDGVGVAVIELHRNPAALDLTASRRLALAAEQSGVPVLLLRIEGAPGPSAAETRWTVRSAASRPLAANAPGHPTLDIALLRQRGRAADGGWQVEWNRDSAIFRTADADAAPLPGTVVSLPGHGPVAADGTAPRRRTG